MMPTRLVERDINHPEYLTDAVLSIEKGRGRVLQILEHGAYWLIVFEATKRTETR